MEIKEIGCESCELRKKYDEKPKSFRGRFWKFHTRFCPGWKAYLNSLEPEKLAEIKSRYQIP